MNITYFWQQRIKGRPTEMYIIASKQPFCADQLLVYNLGHVKGPQIPLAKTLDSVLIYQFQNRSRKIVHQMFPAYSRRQRNNY